MHLYPSAIPIDKHQLTDKLTKQQQQSRLIIDPGYYQWPTIIQGIYQCLETVTHIGYGIRGKKQHKTVISV